MENIVFEVDMQVPVWHRERRLFEVNAGTLQKFLNDLDPKDNALQLSAEEVQDALTECGEIMTRVGLAGQKAEIEKSLRALAIRAWLEDAPWDIEGIEFTHKGEAQFERFVRAYTVANTTCQFNL